MVGGVIQVLGELLITVGLILILFVVWQLWWTNLESDKAQADAVDQMKQNFRDSGSLDDSGKGPEDPIIGEAPAHGQGIGIMYIPRFGEAYERPVIQGTGRDVLDTLGVGHYESTAMPGDIGNFAVAGHRQTNGKVFDQIDKLVTGDRIYVRTAQGYYTYVFRNNEIVLPSQTDVIAPVPGYPGEEPQDRIMTLTSCNPRFGSTERIIAYAVFEGWQPNSAGPPPPIADLVGKDQ
ncbi:class E sortase [Kocuria sp. TGY1127_2]|uniref:class E sortase n=1 Tax=Kocuria sp. TGY1127_2 TaxID=2711328 RepID=UPI0015BCE279